jgi:hypothetical protein
MFATSAGEIAEAHHTPIATPSLVFTRHFVISLPQIPVAIRVVTCVNVGGCRCRLQIKLLSTPYKLVLEILFHLQCWLY